MPTYPMSGTLADLGLEALDGDPVLRFSPPDVMAQSDGSVIAGPVEVIPDPNGTFVANLAATADTLTKGKPWRLEVIVREPDGYTGGYGFTARKFPTWHFTVPVGGGRIVDYVNARVADDVFAIVNDPADTALLDDLYTRGVRVVLDTSTTPASFHRLEA